MIDPRRLDETFDKLPDPMMVADADSLQMLYGNRAAFTVTGYSADDLPSVTLLDLYPAHFRQQLQHLLRALRPRQRIRLDEPIVTRDGPPVPAETNVSLLPIAGQLRLLVGMRVLLWSEGQHRRDHADWREHAVVAAGPVGMIAFDPDGRITQINAAMLQIEGVADRPLDSFLETNLFTEHPYAARDALLGPLRGLLGGEPFDLTLENFENLSGDVISVALHGVPLIAASGETSGGLVLVEDVTDRREGERRLRQSEANLRALFDSTGDFLFVADLEGRIIFGNLVLLDRLGYTQDELAGMPVEAIHLASSRALLRHLWAQVPVGGVELYQIPLVRRDGRPISVETKLTRARWDDRDVLFGIGRDISERAHVETLIVVQRDLGVALSMERDLGRVYALMSEAALAVSQMDCALVFLVEADRSIRRVYEQNVPDALCDVTASFGADSLPARMVQGGAAIYAQDELLPAIADQPYAAQLQTMLMLPIKNGADVIGALAMASQRAMTLPPATQHALETIGAQVGGVIARLRAEAQLQESEARYRGLIESQRDLIVRVDSAGRFTFVNDAYCRKFGKRREELLGTSFVALIHPDDRAPTLAAMEALETPPFRATMEQRAMTAEGWRWLAWEDYAIRDESGEMREIQAVGRDITEQKQAEELRRESEETMRALLNAPIYAALLLDRDSTILAINDAGAALFGQPVEALIGQRVRDIPEMARFGPHENVLAAVFAAGEPQHFELEFGDGVFEIAVYPLHDRSRAVDRVAIFARDITAQKHTQRALERQDRLIQGVANATNRLLQPGSDQAALQEALDCLGEAADIEHAYIVEAQPAPDEADTLLVWRCVWMRDDETRRRLGGLPDRRSVREEGLEAFVIRLRNHETLSSARDTLPPVLNDVFTRLRVQSYLLVPIFIGETFWGAIGLNDSHRARGWTRDEESALSMMAASVGAAIQRQQVEETLRHERKVADTLREVGTALNKTLELDEIMGRMLVQVQRIVPYDTANVMLLQSGEARIVHCRGHDQFGVSLEVVKRVIFNVADTPPIARVVERKAPVLLRDTRDEPGWVVTPGSRHVRCWLGVPILTGRGDIVGLFALDSREPDFYTEQHVEMLKPFAQQAAIAFENAQLYEQQRIQSEALTARLQQISALREASESILSTLELDEILLRFAQQMTNLTPANSTRICDYDAETKTGIVQANWPPDTPEEETFRPQRGDRLDFSSPLLHPLIEQHDVLCLSAEDAMRAFPDKPLLSRVNVLVIVPVVSQGRLLGLAFVRDDVPSHTYGENEIQLCRALASQAAIAFEQATLFQNIQKLERVKSEMIRMASHDLRGPLTRLQALLDAVEARAASLPDGLPDDLRSNLHMTRDAASEMTQIVANILSLERIEAKRQQAEPIIWAELFERVRAATAPDAAARQQALIFEPARGLPPAQGDAVRLERAVVNLVQNAIKYTPPGGRITVRTIAKDYGGTPCVAVEVEDNGIGIPLEHHPHLFEPYYRVPTRGNGDVPGDGLGLSVVKDAVTYHNGSVYVDSEPGRGSLFGFRIPL